MSKTHAQPAKMINIRRHLAKRGAPDAQILSVMETVSQVRIRYTTSTSLVLDQTEVRSTTYGKCYYEEDQA